MMNGQLDVPFLGLLEQKNEKSRCMRIDSDVIDNLISKENRREVELSQGEKDVATQVFQSQAPTMDKAHFMVSLTALAPDDQPIVVTQSEYMRRMKDMAQFQPGMSFYGEIPDSYNLMLNTNHRLVKQVVDDAMSALAEQLKPIDDDIAATNNVVNALRDLRKDNKELPEDKKKELDDNEKRAHELRDKKNEHIGKYAAGQPRVKQLIDIALLGNGLLKGEALSDFLRRSVELL